MRRYVLTLVLSFLLVSVFVAVQKTQIANAWSGTVYIRGDGSIDPPTAPMERNGSVYTLTGNVTSDADGIVVERNSIVFDGSGYTVEGAGTGYGVYLDGRNNVTIRNTDISNFDNSILLFSSSDDSISGNNMTNSGYGIVLDSSSNNTIDGNNMKSNNYGIGIGYSSDHNGIGGNTVANNGEAIWLYESSDNTICRNNFINNTVQVDSETPDYANSWDKSHEGNYWSNYNGTDVNHDAIGDAPYIIDANNTDHYPLMNIVPEFPSFLVLSLFMIATLLAILVYRKSHGHLHFHSTL